jgi:hypothetical protein
MKKTECFIFEPGTWLGEGKVKLSISEEELKFVTRWNVDKVKKAGSIMSLQEVQITGISEVMNNQFMFYDFDNENFKIELENPTLGKILGTGIYRPKLVAWEFRANPVGFEGFEMYQLLDDGSYFMHAEYIAQEDFRTQIQGRIWKKATSS